MSAQALMRMAFLPLVSASSVISGRHVVNKSAVSAQLTKALNAVDAALTTDELVALNKMVDVNGADPAQVAQTWLSSKGLA